jgi:hypothetical protein
MQNLFWKLLSHGDTECIKREGYLVRGGHIARPHAPGRRDACPTRLNNLFPGNPLVLTFTSRICC